MGSITVSNKYILDKLSFELASWVNGSVLCLLKPRCTIHTSGPNRINYKDETGSKPNVDLALPAKTETGSPLGHP